MSELKKKCERLNLVVYGNKTMRGTWIDAIIIDNRSKSI